MKKLQPDRDPAEIDFLWRHLKDLPYFRALLRAVESRFYQDYDLPSPVLDLGCGDGHFASVTFNKTLDVGLDPWTGPVHEAALRGCYKNVIQGAGALQPFPDEYFSSAISNSVLEHIEDLDPVIFEISRVLKPGSLFIFSVPNHQFLSNLSVSNFFDRLGLKFLGNAYRRFFNRISRHHHCDAPETWKKRLNAAGFSVEKYWHYFSPGAFHTLEWGHYFGLPSWITHALFGKWVIVPQKWNFSILNLLIHQYYVEPSEQPDGAYTFYIARKQ
ncbi:MAG: class I SAM-dependent methyltransferase [Anaerolineaceae bacterium]